MSTQNRIFVVWGNGKKLGEFCVTNEQAAKDACARGFGFESEFDMEESLERVSDFSVAEKGFPPEPSHYHWAGEEQAYYANER